MKYTATEISELYNAPKRNVDYWIIKSKVKGFRKSRNSPRIFTEQQLKKILQAKPVDLNLHPRKIKIVEMRLLGYSLLDIGIKLNMNHKYTEYALQEFKKTGCVTVESKLNRML